MGILIFESGFFNVLLTHCMRCLLAPKPLRMRMERNQSGCKHESIYSTFIHFPKTIGP